jgi:hypothetical protein
MRGSHTIICTVALATTSGAEGGNAWEGEALTALQRVRQACPGTSLEVRAITLQRHLTEMGREVTTGIAVDDQGECRPLVEQLGEVIEGEAQQVGGLAGIRRNRASAAGEEAQLAEGLATAEGDDRHVALL